MWRATNDSIESYREFQLYELIPDNDMHHMIYYNNNPILFLLALVDTIDPIKNFCRNRRHRQAVSSIEVLENVYLQFISYSGMKQLRIIYNSPAFDDYANSIAESDTGLSSWLGTHIRYTKAKDKLRILSISVDMNDTKATDNAIA